MRKKPSRLDHQDPYTVYKPKPIEKGKPERKQDTLTETEKDAIDEIVDEYDPDEL